MGLIFPDVSKQYCADLLFERLLRNSDLYLCLFQNNYTVTNAATLSSLVECNYSGYSRISLGSVSGWTIGGIDGDDFYDWTLSASVDFSFSGGSTINAVYGMYIVSTHYDYIQPGPPPLYLLCAQNLQNTPVYMSAPGNVITAQPILRMGALFNSP